MTAIKTVLDKDGVGTIHKSKKTLKCSSTNKKSHYLRYDAVNMEYLLCRKSGTILSNSPITL